MNSYELQQFLELAKLSGVDDIFIKTPLNKIINKSDNNLIDNDKKVNIEAKYTLEQLKEICLNCKNCKLSNSRKNVVFGEGNKNAKAIVIGEAPGQQEDEQAKVFVGKSGQLLTKMLIAININRKDIYIANIIKCRPPGNRNPEPEEVKACIDYLQQQILIIKPKVILLLGRVAAQTLLKTTLSLSKLRQKKHIFMNIPVFITYHPSALLRHSAWKKDAWVDLQKFRDFYNTI